MHKQQLKEFLRNIDPSSLEVLFRDLLSRQRWGTIPTQDSWDGGVDVYGWYPKEAPQIRIGFDTKRYGSANVTASNIHKWADNLNPDYPLDRYCLVLTSEINKPIRDAAKDRDVDIISFDGLTTLIDTIARDRVLCEQYHRADSVVPFDPSPSQLQARLQRLGVESTLGFCEVIINSPVGDHLIYGVERAAFNGEAVSLTTSDIELGTLPKYIEYYLPELSRLSGYPFPGLNTGRYWGGGASTYKTPWQGRFNLASQLPPQSTPRVHR